MVVFISQPIFFSLSIYNTYMYMCVFPATFVFQFLLWLDGFSFLHFHCIHTYRTRLITLNQWLNLLPSYFKIHFPPNHQKWKKKLCIHHPLSISHNTVYHYGVCVACVCILCKFKIETEYHEKKKKKEYLLCNGIDIK